MGAVHHGQWTEEETTETLGTEAGGSTESGEDGEHTSPSSSCPTPNSTDLPEIELSYTIGTTQATPYLCQFCDKAFPRLSFLKKHEQTHSEHMPFRCDFCRRLFKHKRSRDRHIKLHTGDKKYKCTKCDAAFSRSDHLKIHMKTHDNQKPYQCTACNRGYNTAAALTSHIQNHTKSLENRAEDTTSSSPPRFKCLECEENFQRPEEMAVHMMYKHPVPSTSRSSKLENLSKPNQSSTNNENNYENPYNSSISTTTVSCPLCPNVFPSVLAMQMHVFTAHGVYPSSHDIDLYCPMCKFSAPNLLSFSAHMTVVHDVPVTLEPLEDTHSRLLQHRKRILNEINLSESNHNTTSDSSSPSKFGKYDHAGTLLCNQCGAAVPDFESFRTHLKSHIDESFDVYIGNKTNSDSTTQDSKPLVNGCEWTCPHCGSQHTSSNDFTQHLISHFLITLNEYKCQNCPKNFQQADQLHKHLIDHHMNHYYKCDLCDSCYSSKVDIQVHFRYKHCTETRILRCNMCDSLPPFKTEYDFLDHVKSTHSGPARQCKKYSCLFCPQSFKSDVELQLHISGHVKQYKCPVCGESFPVEYLLDKHVENVHAGCELSLNCAYCNEQCQSRNELENHMKTHSSGSCRTNGKHKCNICDEICQSATLLAEHKLTHCKVLFGSLCTHCKSLIANEEQFLLHLLQHSCINNSGQQQVIFPVACVICRQTLGSEMEAQLHSKFHLQMSVYQCRACSKQYDVLELMDGLCKTCQAGQPSSPVNCKHCLMKFETSGELEQHMATAHSTHQDRDSTSQAPKSIKPVQTNDKCQGFICRLCTHVSSSEQHLQIHLIEHTFAGCQNFTCYICSAVFTGAPGLQIHILQHGLDSRPYDCHQCTKKFFFRAELDHHSFVHNMENGHSDESK